MSKLGIIALLIILTGCVSVSIEHINSNIATTMVLVELKKDDVRQNAGSATLIGCEFVYTGLNDYHYVLKFLSAKHVMIDMTTDKELIGVVRFVDGSKYVIDGVILHEYYDCAYFTAKAEKAHEPILWESSEPKLLEQVFSAGWPAGEIPVITDGIINFNTNNIDPNTWSCTASAFFGHSGGAVVRKSTGKLLGMTRSILPVSKPPGYLGYVQFFVPISYFDGWLKEVSRERTHK